MSELVIHSKLKDYEVVFTEDFCVALRQEISGGGFVLCDSTVYKLYHQQITQAVNSEHLFIIEANETNKTLDKCQEIIKVLVERKLRRNQKLIALGGGIVQDLTAFISSILYRGVAWSFFPTTLLAQGDSCIGSKTSINLGETKNLLGNFYPPERIYIDTRFLETLEVEDIKSGIGEMLHFYYYADSPLIKKLVKNYEAVLHQRDHFIEYILESLKIKKSVIEIDEFDKGERNKFNYGHTFGHALETVTDYGIRHGQAVTVGMDLANFISWQLGILSEKNFREMHSDLKINFPDYDLSAFDVERYLKALSADKKNIDNNLGCVLSEGPGHLTRRQIPFEDSLKQLIQIYFSEIYAAVTNG